ncbi:hypothetical protein EVAR_36360_1 [Eumeta japonica]|uniref:Uncharacterized protein n=1 Tax=Eumeta variegata TaxID=151549 RepID=A0A4C1W642_EUMVA|nr:hypothetical protein EVAR_36360_1 [Eumeta japonica]
MCQNVTSSKGGRKRDSFRQPAVIGASSLALKLMLVTGVVKNLCLKTFTALSLKVFPKRPFDVTLYDMRERRAYSSTPRHKEIWAFNEYVNILFWSEAGGRGARRAGDSSAAAANCAVRLITWAESAGERNWPDREEMDVRECERACTIDEPRPFADKNVSLG